MKEFSHETLHAYSRDHITDKDCKDRDTDWYTAGNVDTDGHQHWFAKMPTYQPPYRASTVFYSFYVTILVYTDRHSLNTNRYQSVFKECRLVGTNFYQKTLLLLAMER